MKLIIAIPTEAKQLCAHFGHCEEFVFFTCEDGKIVDEKWITPPAHVPGLYPKWVAENGATVVLGGGMGTKAQDLFHQANVDVFYGIALSNPKEIAETYLKGELQAGVNLCDH